MALFNFKEALREIQWVEGSHTSFVQGSYRHRTIVVCSAAGRQKALFSNGEYPYFAYEELLDSKGQWISQGTNVVPVLPRTHQMEERFLMVVEQRPMLDRYSNVPSMLKIGENELDLRMFGPHSSPEFPWGAVDRKDKTITIGALRKLTEETGLRKQQVTIYRRVPPVYPFGSDLALQMFFSVVFLTDDRFAEKVENDGGLRILALTREEVERNIENGIIASGQAALLGWAFYKEVLFAKTVPSEEGQMIENGYMAVEQVSLVP